MKVLLKIRKEYLDKVEQYTKFGYGGSYNPCCVRYIFVLPDDSKYKDYAIYIDTEDFELNNKRQLVVASVGKKSEKKGNFYRINIDEDSTFVAFKYKNRDNSKRYKRYTLTSKDLYDIFNCDGKLAGSPYVVAFVTQYLNNGRRNSGDIVGTKYILGQIDDTWFYDGTERRRLHTKGVRVLGTICDNAKNICETLINKYYSDLNTVIDCIYECKEEIIRLETIVDYALKLKKISVGNSLAETCQKEIDNISHEVGELQFKKVRLEEEFLSDLENHFIK